jgi:hypothetical protein
MTPSEQCKAAGLKSLAELANISGVSVQTLINWSRDKPALFATVVAGAVVINAANAEITGAGTASG